VAQSQQKAETKSNRDKNEERESQQKAETKDRRDIETSFQRSTTKSSENPPE